ncbi:MAG: hypothetical protein ACM3SS_23135 [Rhodospirillaceae bacterium]
MKNKPSQWLCALVVFLPFAAGAVPMTFSDCVAGNPPAEQTLAACAGSTSNLYLSSRGATTLSYTHDLTDDGFLTTDTILSAALTIDFNDDGDVQNESVNIYIDFNGNGSFADGGEQVASNFDPAAGNFSCTGNCSALLANALADGITAIRLSVGAVGGVTADFYFSDSLLTVDVDRTAAVQRLPEPGTLALLGGILFGIGITAHRHTAR